MTDKTHHPDNVVPGQESQTTMSSIRPDSNTHNRAVSDILGYVIIFSVVIVAISLASTHGFAAMQEMKQENQIQGAEYSFEAFAGDVESVYRTGIKTRSSTVGAGGGSISEVSGGELSIEVENTDERTNHLYGPIESNVIQYQVDSPTESKVTYTYGAVIQSRHDGSLMRHNPPFVFSSDSVVVTAVDISGQKDGVDSQTVDAKITEQSSDLAYTESTSGDDLKVTMTVETDSERAAAWDRYFQRQGLTATSNNDVDEGTVEYTYDTTRVIIRESTITAELN